VDQQWHGHRVDNKDTRMRTLLVRKEVKDMKILMKRRLSMHFRLQERVSWLIPYLDLGTVVAVVRSAVSWDSG
jgi:hypothetical protein